MNHIKVYPLFFTFTFIVGVSIVWVYILPKQTLQSEKSVEEINMSVEEKPSETLHIPKGDEIKVEIKYLKPKKAIVTIYNVSSNDVFMPYLPGIKSDWAYFSCLQEEKLNSKTKEFETLQGSDVGCGMHTLPAKKSFKYLMWVPESGSYRVKANYSVDKRLHEQIENTLMKNHECFNEKEAKEIDDKIILFTKVIISRTIKL